MVVGDDDTAVGGGRLEDESLHQAVHLHAFPESARREDDVVFQFPGFAIKKDV